VNESEARAVAEAAREVHSVPAGHRIEAAERRIIELLEAPPPQAQVRDTVAWIVRFGHGPGWVELAIDDGQGTVVRVERGRG
jgi:hypothetical protein